VRGKGTHKKPNEIFFQFLFLLALFDGFSRLWLPSNTAGAAIVLSLVCCLRFLCWKSLSSLDRFDWFVMSCWVCCDSSLIFLVGTINWWIWMLGRANCLQFEWFCKKLCKLFGDCKNDVVTVFFQENQPVSTQTKPNSDRAEHSRYSQNVRYYRYFGFGVTGIYHYLWTQKS
jgi:hypothetical protein